MGRSTWGFPSNTLHRCCTVGWGLAIYTTSFFISSHICDIMHIPRDSLASYITCDFFYSIEFKSCHIGDIWKYTYHHKVHLIRSGANILTAEALAWTSCQIPEYRLSWTCLWATRTLWMFLTIYKWDKQRTLAFAQVLSGFSFYRDCWATSSHLEDLWIRFN